MRIIPVSYTHLDVYKRQAQEGAAVVINYNGSKERAQMCIRDSPWIWICYGRG